MASASVLKEAFYSITFRLFILCVYVYGAICDSAYMEVSGQFVGIGSLFPPGGSWVLNSGCEIWHQMPLFTETFPQPGNSSVLEFPLSMIKHSKLIILLIVLQEHTAPLF